MYVYDDFDQKLVDERVAEFRDQVARRLSGALTELGSLPVAVRAPAEAWMKKAQAQIAALAAARRLADGAIATLGKAAP